MNLISFNQKNYFISLHLGIIIITLLTSFIFKKLNIRKNNVFTEMMSNGNELDTNNVGINMKSIMEQSNGIGVKDGSPLYCNPKEICSLQDEADYAIPDVICPSNLSKTLHNLHNNNSILYENNNKKKNYNKKSTNQMINTIISNNSKTLQINPQFYASADLIHQRQK